MEKTDDSVTLSWIRSNAIGASSLLGYTVEMFGRNSTDGWVQVANRIQNTTYKVIGLTSGVSYYFAVRAENSHGMSAPSQLSEPIIVGVVRVKSSPSLHLISFCLRACLHIHSHFAFCSEHLRREYFANFHRRFPLNSLIVFNDFTKI